MTTNNQLNDEERHRINIDNQLTSPIEYTEPSNSDAMSLVDFDSSHSSAYNRRRSALNDIFSDEEMQLDIGANVDNYSINKSDPAVDMSNTTDNRNGRHLPYKLSQAAVKSKRMSHVSTASSFSDRHAKKKYREQPSPASQVKQSTKIPSEHKNISNKSNNVQSGISQNQESGYDSDDEEDDTLSVIEEAYTEDTASDSDINASITWNMKDSLQFLFKWVWKFFLYILLVAFFMAPGLYCKYIDGDKQSFCTAYGTPLINYCLMISVSVFGLFFADLVVMLSMMLIKRLPFLGIQFLYYIKNIRNPLRWTLVTLIIFITWPLMFSNTKALETSIGDRAIGELMQQIFGCLLATAFAFLAKGILLRFMAIGFHRGAYYRRIKNALFSEYVLRSLVGESVKRSGVDAIVEKFTNVRKYVTRGQTKDTGSTKIETSAHQELLPIKEEEFVGKKKISTHQLAVCVEYIKNTPLAYDEDIYKQAIFSLHSKEGALRPDEVENNSLTHNEYELKISNSKASKLLARYVYLRLRQEEQSRDIDRNDFARFLHPALLEDAFSLFDGNWDGSITEQELFSTLLSISRERKALKSALNDAEYAIDRLDVAVTALVWLVLFVSYFIIFGVDTQKVLLTLSSFLLAIAFAIGNSAKALLESIIFIFIRHPFDIGDRIVVDKVIYTITRVSLLTTEVRRFDNAVIYFNNADLSSQPILNLRRSPDQFDILNMQISFSTPTKTLRIFEHKLSEFLRRRSTHFYEKFEVEYVEIENSNRLLMRIWVQHRGNFQNMRKYRERRGRLILRLKRLCEELEIEYELPGQRIVHDGLDWNTETNQETKENAQINQQHLTATIAKKSVPTGYHPPSLR